MQKAGQKETSCLFSVLIGANVTIDAVWGFVNRSGTAAAINAALSLVFALLGVWVINLAFGRKELFEVAKEALGSKLAIFAMCLFFIFTLFNGAVRMSMYTHAIASHVLTGTPAIMIAGAFALCSFFAAYFGLEAITRYSVVMIWGFLVFLAVIIVSNSSEIEFSNLFPILGKGGFGDVFSMMYIFSDIMYIYVIKEKIAGKAGVCGVKSVLWGIAVVLVALFFVLCVPYPVSQEHRFPLYTLASLVSSSVVFQRLDGLVFVMWMFAGFISCGALTLFATEILKKSFALSDRRSSASIVALLTFLLSISDLFGTEFIRMASSWICFVVLPALSIICVWMRRIKNA